MANDHLNRYPPRVILYGGTGQSKVVRPIVESFGARVVLVVDDTPGLTPPFPGVPVIPGERLPAWLETQDRSTPIGFSITIGNPHGRVRLTFHDRLESLGLVPVTVVHPSAIITPNAEIGVGCQIMAGALIMAEARLGRQVIVNTKASVDHECVIGDGAELAPGATLCGSVHLDTNAWVCAGATVIPRCRIGADAIVGAGAVVVRDVPPAVTVVGVPARQVPIMAATSVQP